MFPALLTAQISSICRLSVRVPIIAKASNVENYHHEVRATHVSLGTLVPSYRVSMRIMKRKGLSCCHRSPPIECAEISTG